MTIATIHSAFQSSIPFAERLLPSLTSRQKTIAAIAAAIFAAIALTTFVYRLFVPKNINIVAHDEIHSRIPTPYNPQPSQTHPVSSEQVIHNEEESKQLPPFKSDEHQVIGISEEPMAIHIDTIPYPIYIRTKLDFFTDIELNTERLLDYAVINYKNTTCVEDAKIILMGERHTNPKHHDLEVAIINQFGNDGDVFLLEGVECEPFIPDINYAIYGNISKNIHMSGWEENLSLVKEMLAMVKELDTKKTEYLVEKQRWEDNISPNQEKMQKSLDVALTLFCRFDQIVNERNNFLMRSIKRALTEHPHSKIFVMAGKWHILASETGGLVAPFNLLDHMPENEKCAALIFKD